MFYEHCHQSNGFIRGVIAAAIPVFREHLYLAHQFGSLGLPSVAFLGPMNWESMIPLSVPLSIGKWIWGFKMSLSGLVLFTTLVFANG